MKKSLKIILAVMLVMFLGMSSFSMAASGTSGGEVALNPSKSSVKSGESFTVVVSQECSDGIIGFEASLNYDSNVFDFKGANMASNWTNLGEGTKLEAMSNNDQTSGDVFILNFDVKENVSETTSEISLSGVKFYKTAEETISVADKKVTIKVNEVADEEETPTPVTLSSISVTNGPTKTEYTAGEKFDVSGMEITAKYSDGTSKKVTDFTYSPNGELKTTDKKVTISYKDGDVTKTVEQTITVKAASNGQGSNNNNNNDDGTENEVTNNTTQNTINNNTVKNTTSNNTTNNTATNNTAKNTTTIKSATNNTTNNTSTTNASGLPKTGSTVESIGIAILVLVGIAVISYIGYQKYKEI